MTKLNQIYKCSICGNIVETIHDGAGKLFCCNTEMILLNENEKDASTEKHVPIVEYIGDDILVKVGEVEHPMDEDHFIEWIEIEMDNGRIIRQFLKAGDKAEAKFSNITKVVKVRAYCNLHGLWNANI